MFQCAVGLVSATLPKPDKVLGFVTRGKARTIKVLKSDRTVQITHFGLQPFPEDDEGRPVTENIITQLDDLLESSIFTKTPDAITDTVNSLSYDFRITKKYLRELENTYSRILSFTPDGPVEDEDKVTPSPTEKECYLTLNDLSVEIPLSKLSQMMDQLRETLSVVETKLNSAAPDTTTAQQLNTVAALQSTATYLKTNIFEMIKNLGQRETLLNVVRTERIDPKLLTAISAADCDKDLVVEDADVLSVSFQGTQVVLDVQIYLFEKTTLANDLIPIPYLLDNETYIVDLGEDPIYVPLTARLLDVSQCMLKKDVILCHSVRLREDNCLINLLDNPDQIPKGCSFKKIKPSETPLVAQAENFTVIAQRSPTPCIITLDRDVVTDNPVMISHATNLTVVSGSTELTIHN